MYKDGLEFEFELGRGMGLKMRPEMAIAPGTMVVGRVVRDARLYRERERRFEFWVTELGFGG